MAVQAERARRTTTAVLVALALFTIAVPSTASAPPAEVPPASERVIRCDSPRPPTEVRAGQPLMELAGTDALVPAPETGSDQAAHTLPGEVVGAARLGGRVTPITAVPVEDEEGQWIGAVISLVLDGRTIELATAPAPWAPNGNSAVKWPLVGIESLVVTPSGTYLTVAQVPGRGDTRPVQRYRWWLDEPCTGGPADAPPAGSRRGSATYTG